MEKIKGLKLEVNFTELYDGDDLDIELIAEALRRIVDQIEVGETYSSADDYIDEFSVEFEYTEGE